MADIYSETNQLIKAYCLCTGRLIATITPDEYLLFYREACTFGSNTSSNVLAKTEDKAKVVTQTRESTQRREQSSVSTPKAEIHSDSPDEASEAAMLSLMQQIPG